MSRLDPRLLLQGYAGGIFPMADSRDAAELFWVEPRNARDHPARQVPRLAVACGGRIRSGRFTVTLRPRLSPR